MLGGTGSVESEPGKGSCFTIELPAKTPPQPRIAPLPLTESSVPVSASPNSILVIDDDPVIHQLLATALRDEGYSLSFASSGAEGLRLAKELHPAVITL